MKKNVVIGAVVLVLVAAISFAGLAYAQTQTPGNRPGFGLMGGWGGAGGAGYGRGMMRGQAVATPGSGTAQGYGPGMMGGRGWGLMGSAAYGTMHQFMVDALAKELGMTSADLQTALQAGKTPYQIAQEKGLSADQITALMQKVHDEALKQAVASGLLTQQQADYMDQHMEQMWANGFGPGAGGCPGFRGQPSTNPGV